jgi:hypothetical protein
MLVAMWGELPGGAQELALTLSTNQQFQLRWMSPGARFFRLEFSATTLPGNWSGVPYSEVLFSAESNSASAPVSASVGGSRFYRLRSAGSLSNGIVHIVVDAAGAGDQTNISAALADLPPEGGVVTVRAGTYEGGFTVPARVTVRGAGAAQTRVLAPVWNGSGLPPEVIRVAGDDAVIIGLEVDGRRELQPVTAQAGGALIQLAGARTVLRDSRLVNAAGYGVSFGPTAVDALVEGCELLNTATNNTAGGTAGAHQAAVRCQGAARPVIRNNLISGWSQGVALHDGVTNALVEGNRLLENLGFADVLHTRWAAAIEEVGTALAPSVGNRWRSNTISGSAGHALAVGLFVLGAEFMGNSFTRSGQVSGQGELWRVQGGTGFGAGGLVFEGNVITSNGARPESCEFDGGLGGLTIRSNLFTGFTHLASRGPLVLAGMPTVGTVAVVSNLFTGCREGVALTGAAGGVLVRENSFLQLPTNSVAIKAAGGDGHQILGNIITAGQYAVGIRLEAGTNHLVSSNQVTLPGQHVLVLSAGNRIEGNRLEGIGLPGTSIVRIESTNAVGNTATGNLIIGFNADSVAFHFVDAAATNSASSNLVLRATPMFFASSGPGNIVQWPLEPATEVFVGPLAIGGTVLGRVPGLRFADGVLTHVTTNLVQAMSLLPESGATVTLDEGTFDGSFTLPRNTTLRGQGIGRTVVRAPVDGTGQILFMTNGNGNILVEAMTFDGRRSAYAVLPSEVLGVNGVITVDAADVTLRDCQVRDAINNGVFVGISVPGFLIENCLVENSATNNRPAGTPGGHGYGIFCAGSASPIIRSNVVSGWAQGVGLWPGTTNGLVERNRIVDNFGFIDAAHKVTRSACEDYGAGVVPHGWNLWRSNLVDGSTSHCLEIAQGVNASRFIGNELRRPGQISDYGNHWEVTGVLGQTNRDVLIEGNLIISEGLRADNCSVNGVALNTVVSNNTFTGFRGGLGPIFLGGLHGVRGTLVVSNMFTDSVYGVRVNADADGFGVVGNTFSGVRRSDAVVWVHTTGSGRVEGNVITGEEAVVGIKLDDTVGAGVRGGNVVRGNRVRVAASGLLCFTPRNVIVDNEFEETIGNGIGTILLTSVGAVGNEVRGNRVITLSPWALRLSSGATGNTVTNNIIPAFGLQIDESVGINNVILGNGP